MRQRTYSRDGNGAHGKRAYHPRRRKRHATRNSATPVAGFATDFAARVRVSRVQPMAGIYRNEAPSSDPGTGNPSATSELGITSVVRRGARATGRFTNSGTIM